MADNYKVDIVLDVQGDKTSASKVDSMMKKLETLEKRAKNLKKLVVDPNITAKDKATQVIRKIGTNLKSLSSKSWSVTIKAKDLTVSTLSGIKSRIFSLQGAATVALAAVGAGSLGKATLGAAMDFETQSVSMEHWFKGNKQKSDEFVKWLDVFAAKTPFEMTDLFPAGARAVGVSEGDLKMSERMIKLSADMAGLTPGKTVQDAMEAIADAQMGEFERMKEFNMKFTKEEMDAAGGFTGFLSQAEKKFSGGAEKLSATAMGRVSTITDFIKSQFRSAGQGMLEAMSPRLQKITEWFDNNQDTIKRWKDNLARLGKEGFERLLSWGERVFNRLKTIIDDPGFRDADWGTKVGILLNEVITEITEWVSGPGGGALVSLGTLMGKILFEALEATFMGAMMEHPILRTVAAGFAGGKVAGAPGAVVGVAASGVAEIPIQAAKSSERIAEAQMQQIRDVGNTVDDYKTNPDKYHVEGGELRSREDPWYQKLNPFKHADGGIFTRPHLGMVAERGGESLIPLSSQMRGRALGIWQHTGQLLGAGGSGNISVSGINVDISGGMGMDEDSLALSIGRKIVAEIKAAWENR